MTAAESVTSSVNHQSSTDMETATAQTFDLVVLDDEGNWKVIASKLTYEDADNKLERWTDVYPNAIADIIETGKHQARRLTLCIFDPKPEEYGTGVYTSLVPSSDDPTVMVCCYEGHTLEALKAQGKVSQGAFQCSWEEAGGYARDLARQRLCKGPQRVTRERWWELLEVLFPARWEQQVGGNSDHEIFMVPECITSTLYTFGVRIGEEYFTITEDYDIPASKLIEACMELK